MTSQRLTTTLSLLVCVTLTGVHFTDATILGDDGMYSASHPWTCSNGQVLDDVTRRCDGHSDCVDFSDEYGCYLDATAMYWAMMTTDTDDYDDAFSYAADFAAQVVLNCMNLAPLYFDMQKLQNVYATAYQSALVTYTD